MLGDQYVHFGLNSILIPFASKWHPVAVAWGVVAAYLLLAVELTSLARARLSKRIWRGVHTASFVLFVMATIHGLSAGTDTKSVAARLVALGVGTVFVGLTAMRIARRRALPNRSSPAATRREMLDQPLEDEHTHERKAERTGIDRRGRRARSRRGRPRPPLRGRTTCTPRSTGTTRSCASATIAPDAIVLDVLMPGTDGLEVCRRLRAAGNRTPVLMLTARHEVSDRVAGLDAGADDYLVKPFALDELLARLRALLRRTSISGEADILRVGDLSLDPQRREAWRGTRELGLTKTEFDLLELLLVNANIVVTRDTIYERIWGYEFETSSKSLDVYIGYLRRKTEADGEPRLIRTVPRCRLHAARGMSLRLRLTLVVAVTFALVVVGCVYAAHLSASASAPFGDRHLPAATIGALHARPAGRVRSRRPGPRRGRRPGGPSLADPDAVTQILDSDGQVVTYTSGQPDSPDRRATTVSRASGSGTRTSTTSESTTTPTACSPSRSQRRARCRSRASIEGNNNVLASLDIRLTAHRARRAR